MGRRWTRNCLSLRRAQKGWCQHPHQPCRPQPHARRAQDPPGTCEPPHLQAGAEAAACPGQPCSLAAAPLPAQCGDPHLDSSGLTVGKTRCSRTAKKPQKTVQKAHTFTLFSGTCAFKSKCSNTLWKLAHTCLEINNIMGQVS